MTSVLRPTFSEGQVLGAGDLNAQVEYDRLGMVLHERTEHRWGVAQGLELRAIEQTNADGKKYVDVELQPGRAVDRLGRAIVVAEPRPLNTGDFQQSSSDPSALFPVFIQAIEVLRASSGRVGACATAHTTRVEETLQISFGPVGSELPILEQEAPVDAGLGTSASNDKVLVGWVSWNAGLEKFSGVAKRAGGRGIRYVGVIASDVVSPGGALALRTRPGGSRFAMELQENSTGGCELVFGKQDGNDPVTPVLRVDHEGNLRYEGTLSPLPPSKTLAESGIVFDGLCLPLPIGVTADQVSSGALRLHVTLTPILEHPSKTKLASGKTAIPLTIDCHIDLEVDRRVLCRVRWYDPLDPDDFVDRPGACNYVVIASGK
jgi:hypothetical protein